MLRHAKRAIALFFLLGIFLFALTGCSVLEARYNATAAQAAAKSSAAYAQAEAARAAALETQALQVTAQVAQVEASNRLMAFLATLNVIAAGQSNALLLIVCVIGAVCIVGLLAAQRGQR